MPITKLIISYLLTFVVFFAIGPDQNGGGWLAEANTSIQQLQSLSHDLKNGSIDNDEAIEFINQEKKQAEASIEVLKINTEAIRKHLEVFNQALPVCENLVKELNSGLLPQLLPPDTKQN